MDKDLKPTERAVKAQFVKRLINNLELNDGQIREALFIYHQTLVDALDYLAEEKQGAKIEKHIDWRKLLELSRQNFIKNFGDTKIIGADWVYNDLEELFSATDCHAVDFEEGMTGQELFAELKKTNRNIGKNGKKIYRQFLEDTGQIMNKTDIEALKRELYDNFIHACFPDGANKLFFLAGVREAIDYLASRNLIRGAVEPIDGLDVALQYYTNKEPFERNFNTIFLAASKYQAMTKGE